MRKQFFVTALLILMFVAIGCEWPQMAARRKPVRTLRDVERRREKGKMKGWQNTYRSGKPRYGMPDW